MDVQGFNVAVRSQLKTALRACGGGDLYGSSYTYLALFLSA
jgi:hypothetical protein